MPSLTHVSRLPVGNVGLISFIDHDGRFVGGYDVAVRVDGVLQIVNSESSVDTTCCVEARVGKKREKARELWRYGSDIGSPSRNHQRELTNILVQIFKEEKERKKFAAKLPKCEKLLEEEISSWERENGDEFLIMGLKLTDYIEFVREQHETEKQQVVFLFECVV